MQSLYSVKATASSPGSSSHAIDKNEAPFLKQDKTLEGFSKSIEPVRMKTAVDNQRQDVLKLYGRVEPCFWWFRSVNLKFGNVRVSISNGKILSGCLFLLAYMVLRRNQSNFKRLVFDFWSAGALS